MDDVDGKSAFLNHYFVGHVNKQTSVFDSKRKKYITKPGQQQVVRNMKCLYSI